MNCCSLDRAEITSPRALKLLLMDWASCETQETSGVKRISYEMVGLSKGVEIQSELKGNAISRSKASKARRCETNEITLSCSAVAPVLAARSEPAKSTKLI